MKKVFIIVTLFCLAASTVYAYEKDEKKDLEKIEELILREDFDGAKARCERFLRRYRRSQLAKRVEYLKDIASAKISGQTEGTEDIKEKEPPYREKKYDVYYIVQVGAFKEYKNASRLKRALSKKGFEAVILKVRRGKSIFYKVRVGKFRELANAERLVADLKKKGYPADIINEE